MSAVKLVLVMLVCAATMKPEAMAGEREVRAALPKLPRTAIVAGNLVRNGEWYALSSKQISSIRNVLTKVPFSIPPEITVVLPPLQHKIILWTSGEEGLVPEDVVECDEKMSFFFSTKNARMYSLADLPEREELQKLVAGIKDGTVRAPGRD